MVVFNCRLCSEDKDLVHKDAVYFSTHKFVGGVDSPGEDLALRGRAS